MFKQTIFSTAVLSFRKIIYVQLMVAARKVTINKIIDTYKRNVVVTHGMLHSLIFASSKIEWSHLPLNFRSDCPDEWAIECIFVTLLFIISKSYSRFHSYYWHHVYFTTGTCQRICEKVHLSVPFQRLTVGPKTRTHSNLYGRSIYFDKTCHAATGTNKHSKKI